MTTELLKDEYKREREEIKAQINALKEKLDQLKAEYIEHAAPCKIGDIVEIQRQTTRITGEAKAFGILQDGFVYVTALNVGKTKQIYISQPYMSIKVVN